MDISLVICTRNRAQQLRRCLAAIEEAAMPPAAVEIVVIDNGSTDETGAVLSSFAASSRWTVRTGQAERIGLGHARNCGIRLSSGRLLVFTDDDCYIEPNYFLNLLNSLGRTACHYGMGQILLYDRQDDPRVANMPIQHVMEIPPYSILPTGTIQGANMFFLREVFERAGLFDDSMGAGTEFPCEDIEMAFRASSAGFKGALLPGFTVYHHHGRRANSPEAARTVASYDIGRGAYFASMLARGVLPVWTFWQKASGIGEGTADGQRLAALAREFRGAADYFAHLSEKNGVPVSAPAVPAPQAETPGKLAELEAENARLRHALSDLMLEKIALVRAG